MYTNPVGVYMVKLYWRIKKPNGRWTWKPAVIDAWTKDAIMLLRKSQTDINGKEMFHYKEEEE